MAPMSVILAVVLATMTFGWVFLLFHFWALRKTFEVRARSPSLVLVSMVALFTMVVSVLSQWLMVSLGKSFPCYVMFAVSYIGEVENSRVCSLTFEVAQQQ